MINTDLSKLTVYEMSDLIRTLEYAKKKKREECMLETITQHQLKLDLSIIDNLLERFPKKYNKKQLDQEYYEELQKNSNDNDKDIIQIL